MKVTVAWVSSVPPALTSSLSTACLDPSSEQRLMVRLELHLEMCANDSGGGHGPGPESVKDGHRGSEKLSNLPGVTQSGRGESGSKLQLRGCNRDLFQSIPSSLCRVDDIKKHSLQIRKFKEESVTCLFLPCDHRTHWVERLSIVTCQQSLWGS